MKKKTRILKDLRKDRDAYRENIAYKNLEDEIKYQNELNYVNAELDKYKNYESYDEVKEVDTNKTSHIGFYILICLILVFLGIYTKQYYLFTLAIILPLISILIDKNSNISSSEDTLNYKRDEDYLEYMRLSKEKEKLRRF